MTLALPQPTTQPTTTLDPYMTGAFAKMVLRSTHGIRPLTGVFDYDSVSEWLTDASTANWEQLKHNTENDEFSLRYAIRALAASMPGRTLDDMAARIHAALSNTDLSVSEVKMILQGNRAEVPIVTLQQIGKHLANGDSYQKVARTVKVNPKTVGLVDRFLGITLARKDRLLSAAVQQLEDGDTSTRAFMRRHNLTHHEARTIMGEAKAITEELA